MEATKWLKPSIKRPFLIGRFGARRSSETRFGCPLSRPDNSILTSVSATRPHRNA
jgi:hypothetical protein